MTEDLHQVPSVLAMLILEAGLHLTPLIPEAAQVPNHEALNILKIKGVGKHIRTLEADLLNLTRGAGRVILIQEATLSMLQTLEVHIDL